MKFGCCADRSKAKILKEIGFDYIELGVSGDLKPLEKESSPVDSIREVLSESGLPVEAFNGLVPGSLKITGPNRDLPALVDYISTASLRAAELGGKILVFGSGGARMVPDGYEFERAEAEIVEFLSSIAQIIVDNGLILAIEPLQKAECNIINSVDDGVKIVHRVNRLDAVTVLSDLYHVEMDGQSFDETKNAGKLLKHVHVACGSNRHAPNWGDFDELVSYFTSVKAAGYDSRVSIEGNLPNFDKDAATGLEVLRKAWSTAAG